MEDVASELLDTCLYKGSRDNMTAVIVTFPGAPGLEAAAVNAEKKLNEVLEAKVTQLIANHGPQVELWFVLQQLEEEEDSLPGLPPGGGIDSKKGFLEDFFKNSLNVFSFFNKDPVETVIDREGPI